MITLVTGIFLHLSGDVLSVSIAAAARSSQDDVVESTIDSGH
jgi:hypothetical protein